MYVCMYVRPGLFFFVCDTILSFYLQIIQSLQSSPVTMRGRLHCERALQHYVTSDIILHQKNAEDYFRDMGKASISRVKKSCNKFEFLYFLGAVTQYIRDG